MIFANTNVGRVVQIESLIEEMQSIKIQYLDVKGEMHYSKCWETLKEVLEGENGKDN